MQGGLIEQVNKVLDGMNGPGLVEKGAMHGLRGLLRLGDWTSTK
jgi:hypothetical protein